MTKAKRDKRSEREEKKTQKLEARAADLRHQGRKRIVLLAIPTVVLAVGGGAWWGLDDHSLAAWTLLAGLLVWLMVALGFLGQGIAPRDRMGAGNLGYGKKGRR